MAQICHVRFMFSFAGRTLFISSCFLSFSQFGHNREARYFVTLNNSIYMILNYYGFILFESLFIFITKYYSIVKCDVQNILRNEK